MLNEGGGGRTHDLRIKSPTLYQLSYALVLADPNRVAGRINPETLMLCRTRTRPARSRRVCAPAACRRARRPNPRPGPPGADGAGPKRPSDVRQTIAADVPSGVPSIPNPPCRNASKCWTKATTGVADVTRVPKNVPTPATVPLVARVPVTKSNRL